MLVYIYRVYIQYTVWEQPVGICEFVLKSQIAI